jgi:hypothetical protein
VNKTDESVDAEQSIERLSIDLIKDLKEKLEANRKMMMKDNTELANL